MPDLPNFEPPPDCEPHARARLGVGDSDGPHRIPIIGGDGGGGVTTQCRKEGPLSIGRFSEVYYPFQWNDGNIYNRVVESAAEGDGISRLVDVDYRNPATGDFFTAHRGIISAYGGAPQTANRMRLAVSSPSLYLGHIPTSITFKSADVEDILEHVTGELAEHAPPLDDVPVISDEETLEETVINAPPARVGTVPIRGPLSLIATEPKRFSRNRDTLEDVVNWLIEKTGLYLWFEPIEGGDVGLVVSEDPGGHFNTNVLQPDEEVADAEGSLELVSNNSMAEIRPFNTLQLIGETGELVNIGPWEQNIQELDFENDFPIATVQHNPTVERANGNVLTTRATGQTSLDPVKREAKERLKQSMDEVGRGTAEALLDPRVIPFSHIKARPVCGDLAEISANPIDYEVQQVAHHVPAEGDLPKTTVKLGLEVSKDDMEFISPTTYLDS